MNRPAQRKTAEQMRNEPKPTLQVMAEAVHGVPEEDKIAHDAALKKQDRLNVEPPQEREDVTGTTGNISIYYKTNGVKIKTTHDKITEDNCTVLKASPDALSTTAELFKTGGTVIGNIKNLFSTTRESLGKLGLRTFTGGIVIRATGLETAQSIFDDADDELQRLRGELRRQYNDLVTAGKDRLGDAGKDLIWPSAEELAAGWKHRLLVLWDPSSEGSPLLNGVSDEAAAKTRARVQQDQARMMEESQSDLIKQLLAHLIGNGKSNPGILGVLSSDCTLKQGRFRQLKERLEQAKEMNWIELPQIDKTIKMLEPIASLDLDELRESERKRKEASQMTENTVQSITQNSLSALGINA